MKVIADANVIISILIKPGVPIGIILKEDIEIFAPNFLIYELENNKQLILNKSKINEIEIEFLLSFLKHKIKFIPENEFIEHFDEAEIICPDEKDIIYFALSLYLKCPIWSNEKRLKNQEQIKIYHTHELIKILGI